MQATTPQVIYAVGNKLPGRARTTFASTFSEAWAAHFEILIATWPYYWRLRLGHILTLGEIIRRHSHGSWLYVTKQLVDEIVQSQIHAKILRSSKREVFLTNHEHDKVDSYMIKLFGGHCECLDETTLYTTTNGVLPHHCDLAWGFQAPGRQELYVQFCGPIGRRRVKVHADLVLPAYSCDFMGIIFTDSEGNVIPNVTFHALDFMMQNSKSNFKIDARHMYCPNGNEDNALVIYGGMINFASCCTLFEGHQHDQRQ